jgi:hypothetical protein
MPANYRVAAFIVNWNNATETLEAVNSLRQSEVKPDLFIVDNGSVDDSLTLLKEAVPEARFIESEKNLGYGSGANLALRAIADESYQFILSLNNDAIVLPDTIGKLISALEGEARIGMVAPWVAYKDEEKIWFAGGKYYSWFGATRHLGIGNELSPVRSEEPVECDYLCGCCILFRSEIFDSTGPFDDRFFMYSEDLHHSKLARSHGYRVSTLPSALVRHGVSRSTGEDSKKHFSPFRAYYYARNPILSIRWSPRGLKTITSLTSQVAIILPYNLIRMVWEGTISCAPSYIRGLIDGFLGRTGDRFPPSHKVLDN